MRLFLLRHASAAVADGPDSLRPLTPEGRRDAESVGIWLARRAEPPQHVLCSSARRAVETMQGVLGKLPGPPTTSVREDLYLASAWKLFELVRTLDQSATSLLLVGHNPAMAELAARLGARGDPAMRQSVSRRFLPATLAEVELPAERWADLDPDSGTLVSHFIA